MYTNFSDTTHIHPEWGECETGGVYVYICLELVAGVPGHRVMAWLLSKMAGYHSKSVSYLCCDSRNRMDTNQIGVESGSPFNQSRDGLSFA